LFELAKITKDGHFGQVFTSIQYQAAEFITTFGIGGTPGALWVGGLGNSGPFNGQLFKFALTTPPFGYQLIKGYGKLPGNRNSFPGEGPIDSVQFYVFSGIEISKDGKALYLKTGGWDYLYPNVSNNTGDIIRVLDDQVKIIARNVENKRLAISNNGKTLYIAGNGLAKIDF
jgi:hypothetical protein